MTAEERHSRFEELDAGRVLGDLDAAEISEWQALAAEHGIANGCAADLLAAEWEAAGVMANPPVLPAALAAKLAAAIPRPAVADATDSAAATDDAPRKLLWGPWVGWAVAACLLALLVAGNLVRERGPGPALDPREQVAVLQRAADLRRVAIAGVGEDYAAASGEVLWSDQRQEGYMILTNIPANDPSAKQYQLWIVDPQRDDLPVDGGVFDIPAGGGPAVVAIDAKLAVSNPAAFVITLEQPGGVVRSKQEVVVAMAK